MRPPRPPLLGLHRYAPLVLFPAACWGAPLVLQHPVTHGFGAGFWSGFATAAALGGLALLVQRRAHRQQQIELAAQRQHELDQVVARRTADLLSANRTLRDLADTDALTGVSNRRHFDRLLREGFERALLTGRRLSVLLIDVDHFKQVNDEQGHLAGDEVLRQLGTLLQRAVRSDTVVARYGGEEFAVITPGGLADAVGLGERLRRAVEDGASIRVSIGVASFEASLDRDEPALLARADRALYAAKTGGRNRVESDPPGAAVRPLERVAASETMR
ncbi:MAG: GGDEF domain-containing protein [Lysobacterales bacterium]